ncbi:beta strand repeat-containing protein, partial [Vibrio ezurae]
MAKKPEVTPVDLTIAKAKEQQKQAEKLRASELRYDEGDTVLPIADMVLAEPKAVFAKHTPHHIQNPPQTADKAEAVQGAPHQGLDIEPPVVSHQSQHVSPSKPVFTGKVVANNGHAQQFLPTRTETTHGIVDVAATGAFNIFAGAGTLVAGGGIFIARQLVDGHEVGHPVTFTVGSAGAVVIAGDSAAVLTEDVAVKAGDLVASGALVDKTEGPAAFQAYSHDGKFGSLNMDSDGHWQYHADDHQSAIQSLKPGESITDTFTVATNSGIDSTVTVVIKGSEDKAIIAGVHTGDVTEDVQVQNGQLHTDGQLSITDNDHDDAYFIPQAVSTNHGEFTLDSHGHWHFTANNTDPAIQQLAEGETFTQAFTAVSKDGGTTQEVVVTVHGTNDVPVLTVLQNSTKSGQLHTTDIDVTDTHTYGILGGVASAQNIVAQGIYGDLTVDTVTGEYRYKIHADAINNGHGMNYDPKTHTYSGQDSFEVSTTDNHGGSATQYLTFSPTASLTAPTVTGAKPIVHYSVSTPTQVSSIAPTAPVNTPAQPTITIDGLDPTTDSGTDHTDGITDNSNPTVTGVAGIPFSHVTIVDGKNLDGTDKVVGSGYADVNGHYNIVVGLGQSSSTAGSHHDLTATVTDLSGQGGSSTSSTPIVIDQHTSQPTVDLSATSDSFAGTGTNTDNITNVATPTLTLGNIDTDAQHVEVMVDGHSIGSASNHNGVWQITVPKSFMSEGDHAITATVTDIAGNTNTSTALTVTIDQHVDSPDATDSVIEDTRITATGDVNPHAQAGDFVTVINADGQHGHFDVKADGTYTYTLDNAAAQHLAQGESETDSVQYTVTDTAGNTNTGEITVTIDGTNDIPQLHITQNANTAGTLSTNDADTHDTHTYGAMGGTITGTSVVAHGTFGDLTLDSTTGVYSYQMHADAIHQGMNYDPKSGVYSGQETFEVSTTDNHGGSDSQFLTFAPTVTVTAPATVGHQPTVTNSVPTQAQLTATAPTIPVQTPATPTITLHGLTTSTDSGSDHTDGITSNPTPTVTGTTDIPFSLVKITDGKNSDGSDHIVGSGYSDAHGQFDIVVGLGKSSTAGGTHHDLTAKVIDPSGHDGHTTGSTAIVIDQHVDTPTVDLNTNSDTHGANTTGTNTDNLTTDTTPTFTLQGVNTDAASVEVFVDGKSVGSATHTGTDWTFTSAGLTDGDHKVTTMVTDTAGNTSAMSSPLTVKVDTTTSVDAGFTDNLISNTEQSATIITGHVEAGAHLDTLVITDGAGHHLDVPTSGITVKADGSFTTTVDLTTGNFTDGALTVTASSTDKAGNTATSTPTHSTLDTGVATPAVDLNATSDSHGANTTGTDTDNLTKDTTPTFTLNGVDTDAASVEVFIDGKSVGSATHTGTGWTFTSAALTDGDHKVTAVVTDNAGNTSTTSPALTVTVDTQTAVDAGFTDTLIGSGEQAKTVITGHVEEGAHLDTLVITDSAGHHLDVPTSGIAVKADGSFTTTVDLTSGNFTDGALTVTASSTDKAGNTATSTPTHSTLDTGVATPTVDLNASSDSHGVNTTGTDTDNITKDTTPTFTLNGVDTDAASVKVLIDGNPVGSATHTGTGWTFTSAALADGDHKVTAVVTDNAGNTSTTSPVLTVTVDTQTAVDAGFTDTLIGSGEQAKTVITGHVEEGAHLDTLVITDSAGHHLDVPTSGITVKADGSFTTTVDLTTGNFTD